MVFGEEILFHTKDQMKSKHELYLRFMGKDASGLKMSGTIPQLWKKTDNKVIGPLLANEKSVYNIANVNYNKSNIWLIPFEN